MPFLNIMTNVKVEESKEKEIKEALGKAIEVIPGKSEAWLMINIEDESKLYFKGTKDPAVMAELTIYGGASSESLNSFTAKFTDIVSKVLNVASNRIYIRYEATTNWGWNGSNF